MDLIEYHLMLRHDNATAGRTAQCRAGRPRGGWVENRGSPPGFPTDLWTLPRVATVIERLTGVPYHAGHVWYILRGLRWSLQRPARQARERDEPAIRQWIASRWPAVKKTPGAGA